jgi:very-short-patch-repair endonuclease
MSKRGEVLVAIINSHQDFLLAHEQHWYRVPVDSQAKWLKERWPPRWLALYQTKVFGDEKYAIRYYARVLDIRQRERRELFPDQPPHVRDQRRYHQLLLEPLQRLPQPIFSRRQRRIVFIPTTWQKFIDAAEINDLYDESSLEDRLWAEFKRLNIQTERQEVVTVGDHAYFLDFAIYCAHGPLDVETDGDEWHANPEKAALDNLRDNDLESIGWQQLRFTTRQIQEQMADYCIPTIAGTINNLGGVEEESKLLPRRINRDARGGTYQLGLFDE